MRNNHIPLYLTGCIFIGIVLLIRFFTLDELALVDPSEGRYAVAAKDMVDSENWITPSTRQNGNMVPFLAKPPLYIWFSALSMKAFGENEVSARLPSFISGLVTCGALGFAGTIMFGAEIATLAVLALLASVLFFYISGTCIVDSLLTTCNTVAIMCFPLIANRHFAPKFHKLAIIAFIVSLGLGFMTKGPLVLILSGAPMLAWIVTTKRWSVLRTFPWFWGAVLFSAISIPWFVIAELKNPGFLRYFFINENLLRYLIADYGDKYGSGHQHMYGYIWLMWLLAFLPWTPLSIVLISCNFRSLFEKKNQWLLYFIFCSIFPPLFFTFARQVTINYVMPSLPPLSLVTVALAIKATRAETREFIAKYFVIILYLSSLLLAIACLLGVALNISWLQSVISLFVLFGIVALATKILANQTTIIRRVAEMSMLSTAMLFALGAVNAQPWIDANLSSKELAAYLEKNYEIDNRQEKFDFIKKIPLSFYFYSDEDDLIRKISPSMVLPSKSKNRDSVLIIRRSDLDLDENSHLQVKDRIGGWAIVEHM